MQETMPNNFSRSRCDVCGCLDQHVSRGQLRGLSNNSSNMQDLCRKPTISQTATHWILLHLFSDITPNTAVLWSTVKFSWGARGCLWASMIYSQVRNIPELQIFNLNLTRVEFNIYFWGKDWYKYSRTTTSNSKTQTLEVNCN